MAKNSRLKIFISYSHKDMKYKNQLLLHLKSLEYTYDIKVWHDGKILAGDIIDNEVLVQLSMSDIILLLISPNFISSCYCIDVELDKAIKKHNNGECIVVPVILAETIIDDATSFARLSRVPDDGKPIQKFKPQNNGYVNAVAKIKQMVDAKFIDAKKTSVQEPASPIVINLYQHGKESPYVIDDATWSVLKTLKDRIIDFQKIMNEKTIDYILKYKNEFAKNKKSSTLASFRFNMFRSFLLDISLSTREWLFKDVGVRVHFRVLNKSKDSYVGFVVVDGKARRDGKVNWAKKITAMSTTSGMIYYSSELNAPLIKSKNEEFHQNGKHDDIYVDYITSAFKFKDICNTANPLMSMGISIEKKYNKKYAPYLVALSFLKFDVIVENLITLFCTKIKTIDKDFELSSIIE